MPWGYTITQAVRKHQCEDDTFGPLYAALYEFADRTSEEFFYDVEPMEPILATEQCDGRGYYAKRDGYLLPDVINLNPWRHKNGEELVETLAHELAHLWQKASGYTDINHCYLWRIKMEQMGILVAADGMHWGFTARWPAWIEECSDLKLVTFLLPGMDTP